MFISYASDDRDIAKRLFEQLTDAGALHVWWDSRNVRGADLWKNEIDEGLLRSQVVIAVLTRKSVDPERTWVNYELDHASKLLRTIIPCLFEPEKAFMSEGLLPKRFKPTSLIAFSENPEEGLRRLLNAIGDRLPKWGQEFTNHARGIQHKFVGRQKDLEALKDLIDNESRTSTARQLIAVQGIGGMGKTMLAHELVRRLASRYPGGVVIEERGTDPPRARSVLRRWMSQHLKEPAPREYEPSEVLPVLADFYGEMLFLFDDVSIRDYTEVKELLRAVPPLATKILTTRSEDLSNELGLRYPLERLDADDSLELLHARLRDRFASGQDAPSAAEFDRLLKERERALRALVEKVEGHPLALHLGIGTLQNLGGIDAAVEKLNDSLMRGVDSFELETALDAADKNQSLAHSLALSLHELQDNDDRRGTDWVRRFRALGLFPDGAKLPGDLIRAVWDDDEANEARGTKALSGLLRRAMLRTEHSSSLYFSHPVIRAYATGLLTNHLTEHTDARGRYWRWVIERATTGFAKPQTEWKDLWPLLPHIRRVSFDIIDAVAGQGLPINEAATPERLDGEDLEELKAVSRTTVDLGLRLANALKEYIIRRPEREERLQVLRLGLASARAAGLPTEEVEFLKRLGGALARRDPDRARRYLASGLDLAREIGDREQEGAVLSYSGELERTQGKSETALARLNEALEIHRELGNERLQASTLKYRGEVFWRMSRHREAVESYHASQALYEAAGSDSGQADILNKLGSVEFNSGRHRDAIPLFLQALELHRAVGNRSMEAEDLNDMGAAHRYLKEPERALDKFKESLELHLLLGNRRLESITRCNIAGTLCDLERFQEGLSEAVHAKGIAEEVKAPIPRIWAHCWEARALRGLGDRAPAEERLRDALTLSRGQDNPRGLAGVLGMLGDLLGSRKSRREEAVTLLREALAVMEAAELDQAFGGQRRAEIKELLDRLEAR